MTRTWPTLIVSLVRLFAVLIAFTVTPNWLAMRVRVSPLTTVYRRTVAVGLGVIVGLGVAVGVAVAVGRGVAVAVGRGVAVGVGFDVLGLGVAVGVGSTTVVPAFRPVGIKSANCWVTVSAANEVIGVWFCSAL